MSWPGRSEPAIIWWGPCWAGFGWAEVPLPGGCNLGGRPIDQHIKGFVAMGAEVDVRNGLIYAQVPGRGCLAGGQVYLDIVSVGATMNIMLAPPWRRA